MGFSTDQPLALKTDQVVWRRAGDELIVLEIGTATYLTLNGSGCLLWQNLAEGATLGGLAAALVDHYGIDIDLARTDVAAFVAELDARSLLGPAGSQEA